MYTVKFSNAFKKCYKLIKKRGYYLSLLESVINELHQGNPLAEKYRNHQLSENFSGCYECNIKSDWLLIYYIKNHILTLTMVNTGTHSDLSKK